MKEKIKEITSKYLSNVYLLKSNKVQNFSKLINNKKIYNEILDKIVETNQLSVEEIKKISKEYKLYNCDSDFYAFVAFNSDVTGNYNFNVQMSGVKFIRMIKEINELKIINKVNDF